jgi:hypothetical protein
MFSTDYYLSLLRGEKKVEEKVMPQPTDEKPVEVSINKDVDVVIKKRRGRPKGSKKQVGKKIKNDKACGIKGKPIDVVTSTDPVKQKKKRIKTIKMSEADIAFEELFKPDKNGRISNFDKNDNTEEEAVEEGEQEEETVDGELEDELDRQNNSESEDELYDDEKPRRRFGRN